MHFRQTLWGVEEATTTAPRQAVPIVGIAMAWAGGVLSSLLGFDKGLHLLSGLLTVCRWASYNRSSSRESAASFVASS